MSSSQTTTLMQTRNNDNVEAVLMESTNNNKRNRISPTPKDCYHHQPSNRFIQKKFGDISNFLSSKEWVPFDNHHDSSLSKKSTNFFSCSSSNVQEEFDENNVATKWMCIMDPFSTSRRHNVNKPAHVSASFDSKNKVFGSLNQHIVNKQVANEWVNMGCTASSSSKNVIRKNNPSILVTPTHSNMTTTTNPSKSSRSRPANDDGLNFFKTQRPRYCGSRRLPREDSTNRRSRNGTARTTPSNNTATTTSLSSSRVNHPRRSHHHHHRSKPRPEYPRLSTIQPISSSNKGRMSSSTKPKSFCVWRSAKDPKSGRTYYYNTKTRETQWRKPMELASQEERVQMLAKEQKQKDFFASMEANILKNMSSASTWKKEVTTRIKQKKPTVTIQVPKPRMVRTISSMDENVLRDLTRVPSRRTTTATTTDGNNNSPSQRSSTASQRSLNIGELDPLMESSSEFDRSSTDLFGQSMTNFGDNGTNFTLSPTPPEGKKSPELFGETLMVKEAEEAEELSFEELQALTALEQAAEEMKRSTVTTPAHSSMPVGLNLQDSLGTIKTEHLSKEKEQKDGSPPKEESSLKQLARPRMSKRNTCGTIYVGTTMSAPDKDATIKCVCGVYRAHILQSAKEEAANFMGRSQESDRYLVFNDFADQRDPVLVDRSPVAIQALSLEHVEKSIPTLDEITGFYRDVFRRSQMETDCIIMSLIYAERLIKETNGLLRPRVSNWRSILFSCMVLSSKVWDDLSMWNADFGQTCPAGMTVFTLSRINELEVAVLNAFNYNVKVKSSEYAKYYFLLRSMIIKSGLGGEDMSSMAPLDVEGARKLEQVSSSFSHQFNVKPTKLRATKSLGGGEDVSRMIHAQLKGDVSSTSPPGEKAKVSLEHVVNM